jgi:outer membrane murein-binding lipoprotein Lpp
MLALVTANVDLAGLVFAIGLAVVSSLNGKIDKLETKLEAKIDKLETKFDKLEAKFDQLSAEMRASLARVEAVGAQGVRVDLLWEALQPRVVLVQARTGAPADDAPEEVPRR